jgi:outer membrane protein OmpA-like peptidoglycan-associated protein
MRKRQWKAVAASALVWTIAAPLLAQEKDVEASRDHPLVSRYPKSWIVAYVTKEYDEYLFPTGKAEADGPAKSQRLEGKITRITYRVPSGRSTLEVYRNFETALRQAGFQALFTCTEPDCGNGEVKQSVNTEGVLNYWNPGFAQRHLSAKLSRPAGDVYVSLHVIGTDEVSAQLDIVELKPMESGLVTVNAAALAGDITRSGHVAVYGIYFDTGKAEVKPDSDPTLKEIAKLLQQSASLKLYVVGHTDNVGTLVSNMDLSQRRAAAVVQVLSTKYGVAIARLQAEGVGPLSPIASNDTDAGRAKNRRVELVQR